MKQDDLNRIMRSLYTQVFYAKMMNTEVEFFLKFKFESGIKNTLKRMKDNYTNSINQIIGYMPKTNQQFLKHIEVSEEKIADMALIMEKLTVMSDEEVAAVAKDFEGIKVNYQV